MAQCVGYLLAAFGPPLIGALRDTSQAWTLPLTVCLVLSLVYGRRGDARRTQARHPGSGRAGARLTAQARADRRPQGRGWHLAA